jgi:hypothetical protein
MTHDTPQAGGPAPSVNGHAASNNGNPAVSVKDPNPDSESFHWEVPDKPEQKPTAQDAKDNLITIDGEFYKRVGFYSAFNQASDLEFRRAVEKLNSTIDQHIANLTKELNDDLTRYKNGKADADGKITELKIALVRYEEDVEDLKDDLVTLSARLNQLREGINETLINIGTKKETLIKDRQEALLEELNRLNSELENVVKRRMNLNEEIFEKQKEALREKRDFWRRLFEKYDSEHAQVLEKLRAYSVPGFHFLSSRFLYNAGLISATVAGGFFGSFAEANFLASGGAFSFVVQALFTFSTTFLGNSANTTSFSTRLINAGILLAIFLGLLFLMFLVSWLCHFAYQKLVLTPKLDKAAPKDEKLSDPEQKDSAFAINFEGSDELPVTASVKDKSFFGFWLTILPFILFLAIVFILVSLGTDLSTMRSVDASVAGYGVGFLIAVASGGISYVYLTMFLERRIEQQLAREGTHEIRWARLNLELLGIIGAFLLVVMITLVGFDYPFKSDSKALSIVSFMFFAAGCLITAFTLGFGIRLQSLESSRQQLEIACDLIQTKLIRISRPLQIYLTPRENAHFNRKFIMIRDEIMSLMLERTTLTRRAAITPIVRSKERTRFFSNLNRWFRRRLAWGPAETTDKQVPAQDQTPLNEPETFSASEDVRLCFPKLEAELTTLELEAGEVRSKITSVEKEIRYRTEQKGEFYEKKTSDLRHQEIRSRNYHKAMTNREKKFHRDVDEQRWRANFYTQKIVEGYELGEWFTKHNLANKAIPHSTWNGNGNHDGKGVTLDS